MQILVAGMGRFGSHIARTLARAGHEVIAVDAEESAIQRVADDVDTAVEGDATNSAVLAQAGAADVDLAIVANRQRPRPTAHRARGRSDAG